MTLFSVQSNDIRRYVRHMIWNFYSLRTAKTSYISAHRGTPSVRIYLSSKWIKGDVSRCILVLDTSFFVHFDDKYFRTEGVVEYLLSTCNLLQDSCTCLLISPLLPCRDPLLLNLSPLPQPVLPRRFNKTASSVPLPCFCHQSRLGVGTRCLHNKKARTIRWDDALL